MFSLTGSLMSKRVLSEFYLYDQNIYIHIYIYIDSFRAWCGSGSLGVVAPFPPVTWSAFGFACGGSPLRVWLCLRCLERIPRRQGEVWSVTGPGGEPRTGVLFRARVPGPPPPLHGIIPRHMVLHPRKTPAC